MDAANPEIAKQIVAAGVHANVHDRGAGDAVVFTHGSGPGVSAWVNWRLVLPALEQNFRVIAPDMVGFGFTERPADAVVHVREFRDAVEKPVVLADGVNLRLDVAQLVERLHPRGDAGTDDAHEFLHLAGISAHDIGRAAIGLATHNLPFFPRELIDRLRCGEFF